MASSTSSSSSSSSSFVSCYYLIAVTRARRLSVRYTERRNNSALIFEKLRSKFSARCSGFLFNNGKAEHEYYFALIVCIRANTRQLFLTMNYLAYYFVPPNEISLLSYSFGSSLFETGFMYLYICYWMMNIEIWSNEFFNTFRLIFLSRLFHLGESLRTLKETWEVFWIKGNLKKYKLINSKISSSYVSLNLGKDGDYLRKYKVFNVQKCQADNAKSGNSKKELSKK